MNQSINEKYADLKSKKYSLVETRTFTSIENFLDGEWQGNHMHFTSTSNASLEHNCWREKELERENHSYQVHITAIKPNPATVCARLIRTTARPEKKDFTRTEHEFEWMSGEEEFVRALIPRLLLEKSLSSEQCNHEQWFHNCWLSPWRRFMYSKSSPRERQRWREIERVETIQPVH